MKRALVNLSDAAVDKLLAGQTLTIRLRGVASNPPEEELVDIKLQNPNTFARRLATQFDSLQDEFNKMINRRKQ